MSEPAQRPPDGPSRLERASDAISEVLLFGIAVLIGIGSALLAAGTGMVAQDSLMLGPLMLGTAGLIYVGFEQLLRESVPVRSLVAAHERAGVGECVLVTLGAVVVALLGSTLLGLLHEQLGVEVSEQDAILKMVSDGSARDHMLLAISAVALAPLSEEFLFRHMLFRRLMQRAGPQLAWLIPAIAFSAFHFNPSGFIIYIWLGVVFAWAYLHTGRLWVAMAVHAGHNGFALAMLLWMPETV